jgi:YidC/Oxa1 family membrane protein insertase
MMADQKNLILAIVLSISILMAYNFLIEAPRKEKELARQQQQAAQEKQAKPPESAPSATPPDGGAPQLGATATPESVVGAVPQLGVETAGVVGAAGASAEAQREAALKSTRRVRIVSPRISGSIALRGARFDDLFLKDYRLELDPESPQVELLRPSGAPRPYYAEFGWLANDVKTPDGNTQWTANIDRLKPGEPVTLRWDNGSGLIFEQQIALDDNYMFSVTQRVRNSGSAAVSIAPYGLVSRTGRPDILGFYILHEGLLGVFDKTLTEVDYDDLIGDDLVKKEPQRFESKGGWLGITDKYWLTALIPDQDARVRSSFNGGRRENLRVFQADYLLDPLAIPAGSSASITNRLFAGAKEVPLLDSYEDEQGVPRFDLAVDFGWFYFLTKPIFHALLWLNKYLGNYGLAILLLTVAIKLLFFPLANKSYRAMSKMKALQPKMQAMKERFGEDRQRMNQELMALYKKEGVNPAAGCLPMVLQIPVFFALYKVLFVSIEMRHAPFYGWIHDLSARDPLGLLTGFGLISWDVPGMLDIVNIGIWPLIMGATMFLQQKLNPAPTDPMQAKLFLFMPLIFTFILAPFPAGLVIYWTWNNILSITQQWVIMKRMGVR